MNDQIFQPVAKVSGLPVGKTRLIERRGKKLFSAIPIRATSRQTTSARMQHFHDGLAI